MTGLGTRAVWSGARALWAALCSEHSSPVRALGQARTLGSPCLSPSQLTGTHVQVLAVAYRQIEEELATAAAATVITFLLGDQQPLTGLPASALAVSSPFSQSGIVTKEVRLLLCAQSPDGGYPACPE